MNCSLVFPILAAQATLADKLRHVPRETWLTLFVWVFTIVVLVRLWRGLKQMNDYAPYIVAVLASAVLFLMMVYYRNEPRFLTPLVEQMTGFFPTKAKQEQDLERMRRSRE